MQKTSSCFTPFLARESAHHKKDYLLKLKDSIDISIACIECRKYGHHVTECGKEEKVKKEKEKDKKEKTKKRNKMEKI